MRSRNREINIFNMSLLDILTGMLGAFLFLMLGLLPYYAKVSRNKDITPDELRQLKEENKTLREQADQQQKQIDELQQIVKQSAGGPMTAKQIQQLMDQMTQLRRQLQEQTAQSQQQLDQANKEKDFWKAQQGTIAILSSWDSSATDIDILAMSPDGDVYSPKVKDKFMGKECIYDGDDSHANTAKYSHEGLLLYLAKSGDYLIFYRVPQNATPKDYAGLHAYVLYNEVIGQGKGGVVREDSLGDSKATMAKPGAYYAWSIITYNAANTSISIKPAGGKLPKGISLPQSPVAAMPGFQSSGTGQPPPAPHF